jgi:predicted transcriptional regulator
MKEPSRTNPETASQRERDFSILLPAETADRLEHIARSKAMPVDRIIQQLTIEYVTKEGESVQDRIRRGVELVEGLIAVAKDELMLVSLAGTEAFQERQRKRDRLVELGLRAFEELVKISDSEQLARQSEFRLRAFLVLARVGAFTDAVIHNQDEADVLDLIEQLEQTNKELQEYMKKMKAKEAELEKGR